MFNKIIDFLNSKKPYMARRIVFGFNGIVLIIAVYVIYKVLAFIF